MGVYPMWSCEGESPGNIGSPYVMFLCTDDLSLIKILCTKSDSGYQTHKFEVTHRDGHIRYNMCFHDKDSLKGFTKYLKTESK